MKLPIGIIHACAHVLSCLQMCILKHRRYITSYELVTSRLVDPEHVNYMVVYRTFNIQLKSWLKMAFVSEINPGNVHKYLQVEGLQHLETARSRGKGTILLNPHFGPFLFVMPALGHRGYTLNQVAYQSEPITGKREGLAKLLYEAQFEAVEGKMPARFINTAYNAMAMRHVIKALAYNECVLFSPTGRGGKSWHEVMFLGRKATFNLVPFKMAIKTDSVLLPVFVLDSNPLSKIIIEDPLNLKRENTPEELLEKYLSILSVYVKKYPDHFGFFLYDMHVKAEKGIKPFFFSDYPEPKIPRNW